MEARVWSWLERKYGVGRDDPATWTVANPTGLQGMKSHAVFDAIGGETLCAALDALVGAGRWQRPREWGGFLVNFPSVGPWCVPSRVWHTDFDFRGPADPPSGALVFSYLSHVPAGAGGTLAVAGSHRVLAAQAHAPDRTERLTRPGAVVAGVPVRVVELTGEAGDVVIGHPWLLHAGAPNCGAAPRFMRVQRVRVAAPVVSVASVM
jgi:hypothetical protein